MGIDEVILSKYDVQSTEDNINWAYNKVMTSENSEVTERMGYQVIGSFKALAMLKLTTEEYALEMIKNISDKINLIQKGVR